MNTFPTDNFSDAERLIFEAAATARRLTREDLQQIIEYVTKAGFDPDAGEKAGGRLAGMYWQGHTLRGGDRLPPAEVHYLRHVVRNREWPDDTTLEEYIQSIQEVILNPDAYIFTSYYEDREWQLGFIAPSGSWRGDAGGDWILVEYRLSTGHWVTAYQFSGEYDRVARVSKRSNVVWLRR